jgi:hypothetical protein
MPTCDNQPHKPAGTGESLLGVAACKIEARPPVDFKRVSKWLGHSTFTLTLDTYGDYINEDVSQPAGLARPVAQPINANVVPLQRKA